MAHSLSVSYKDTAILERTFFYFRWLLEHAKKFNDVQIVNRTDELTAIAVSGPNSRAVLQELTDADLSQKTFKFMTNKMIVMAGKPVLALRIAYTGKFDD